MSKTILSPSVTNVEELAPNSAAITIEPLANGYGQTLGNSLRRVLLSSIEGAAITAFKSCRNHDEPKVCCSEMPQ